MRHQVFTVAVAACACAPAFGTITQYSTRTAFNAAAGSVSIQDFNSFAPAVNAFEGVWFDFGDFSAMNDVNPNSGGNIEGTGVVNGTTEVIGSVQIGGSEFHFAFDTPITALGFDANNLADQRFDLLLFNNSASDAVTIFDAVDQIRFWGFVSDTPFTSFTIRQTGFGSGGGSQDGFRLDDVTYNTVPQPGAGFVVLIAGAAYSGRRRRL